jgi:PRTRC genetic system protein A
MTAIVDYLVARDGPTGPSGLAYDYVLGGDGLFIAARNRYLDARVPVASAPVRGLPPLFPSVALRTGRLPQEIWNVIVAVSCAWARAEREVLFSVVYDEVLGYQVVQPRQATGSTTVRYRPIAGAVLEIHSHHRFAACFSATDDADEQSLRVYGVLGRLGSNRPEVALRVGAYGYFMPVPWEAVFDGKRGIVRDVHFDPPVQTDRGEEEAWHPGEDDELPD